MGKPLPQSPAMLTMTLFSASEAVLQEAKEEIKSFWGKTALESAILPFEETSYYKPSMGPELKLQLLAFEKLINVEELPSIKLRSSEIEAAHAVRRAEQSRRPLNLDPGYLTPSKFVLASTKDAAHRLFLSAGIFGESTLYYASGAWHDWPWTYPNYRRADYKAFLARCREILSSSLRGASCR